MGSEMSAAPPGDRFSAAGEYSRHRRKALALLARRFPRLDADERLGLYHGVWASVLEKRRRGERIENLEAYLMGGIDKLALKRVGGADARRRVSLDPLGEEMARFPDGLPSPEERVVLMDEVRCAREIVEELDGRERDVIKLRFDLGLEPQEIQARLGLRDRQYRRLMERGARKVVERIAAAEGGGRSRRQRSLFTACLSGMASERQLAEARSLLENDPKARAVVRAMRRSAERAALALPLPAAPGAHSEASSTVGELAAAAKQQTADLAAGAKQQAVSAYVRATDPTPLVGARPGTLAAALAGCAVVGGGTYCAVEGIPDPIKPALGIDQTRERAEVEKPRTPPPAAPAPAPSPPATSVTQPAEPPAAVTPPPPPEPPPPREFFNESPGGASPRPTAPAPAPAQAAGGGEFGGP